MKPWLTIAIPNNVIFGTCRTCAIGSILQKGTSMSQCQYLFPFLQHSALEESKDYSSVSQLEKGKEHFGFHILDAQPTANMFMHA